MDNLHIYLRVSSDSQIEDGFGIQNQKELGLKISKLKNMNPIIINEGSQSSHSDSLDNRPQLRELLLKMEEGEVQHLWVYHMDRLSRNDVVSFQIRRKIIDNNVKLYVGDSNEYNLDNPSDKLMFRIMEGISEFDNSIRSERLRRGRLTHIKNGGWRGGPTPFGYKNVDSKLVIDKEESKWVKKIYEEYGNGKSLYYLRNYLMKNGVLSRRGNIVWNDNSIRNILTYTHYEGFYYYEDKSLKESVKCISPQIRISKRLIKRCRDRLEKSSYKSNYVKTNTLLRDFLECGHCNSKFGQRINKKQYHKQYYCRGNSERHRINGLDRDKVCNTSNPKKFGRVRSVDIDDTDDMVWNTVINVIENSHTFKDQFKKEVMKEVKSFGNSKYDKRNIERRIKKIDKDLSMLVDSQMNIEVNKILGKDEIETKKFLKKLSDKRLELESEKEQLLEDIFQNEKNTKWYNWVNDFKDKIDNLKNTKMNIDEKKKFLEGIVRKVKVYTKDKSTHNIEIEFQSPFVGDIFEWKEKGNPKKGYDIMDGKDNIVVEMNSMDRRLQKKTDQKVIDHFVEVVG